MQCATPTTMRVRQTHRHTQFGFTRGKSDIEKSLFQSLFLTQFLTLRTSYLQYPFLFASLARNSFLPIVVTIVIGGIIIPCSQYRCAALYMPSFKDTDWFRHGHMT